MNRFFRMIREAVYLTFVTYPKMHITVDYDVYWDKKRGKKLGDLDVFQKNRMDIIIRRLKKNKTLLDVGSGDGSIIKYLKDNSFSSITATDISEKALTALKKLKVKTSKLDLEDKESLDNITPHDYILALEVLEHLKSPEEALLALLKKTNKMLVFSVPNTGFIAHRLRLLFGSFPLQWRSNPGEHLRFWTKRDMKWWLKELNIQKSDIVLYEGIPFLNKLWPSLFAMGQIVFIKK